jgi:hypothetical protein
MTMTPESPARPEGGRPYGLSALQTLPLLPENQRALDERLDDMQGTTAWRQRKRVEARALIALSQIASRLVIRALDLRTEVHALIELRDTPVSCMAPGASDIHIVIGALIAIEYPAEILIGPLSGTRTTRLIRPANVYHSNIGPPDVSPPAVCLGANTPRGFPLTEIVLTTYAALTLQAISLDYRDSTGVLDPAAAIWWQANARRAPLTTAPFIDVSHARPVATGGAQAGEGRS